jgi:hypothetical protein
LQPVILTRVYPRKSAAGYDLERAVRLELTNTGSAIRRLSRLATRAVGQTFLAVQSLELIDRTGRNACPTFGAEGEIRTLEASLEDSHVASYITSASEKD